MSEDRTTKLTRYINEGLTNSKENGYFDHGEQFHNATAEDIARDIIAYDDDVSSMVEYEDGDEDFDAFAIEITPIIQAWLEGNR